MCTSRSFHYLWPYCTDFGTGVGESHPGSAPAVQASAGHNDGQIFQLKLGSFSPCAFAQAIASS